MPLQVYFYLVNINWFGSWEPLPRRVLQSLGIIFPIVFFVVSLVWFVLSKALSMLTATSSAADDLTWYPILTEIETGWTVSWTKNNSSTETHTLWVSQWDKRNLTRMVTVNDDNIKFLINLSRMRGGQKWGNC